MHGRLLNHVSTTGSVTYLLKKIVARMLRLIVDLMKSLDATYSFLTMMTKSSERSSRNRFFF
ncbi:hypothetical protein SG26_03160 [Haloarcula sp. CBA1115]|nr:hypothetical protein SG26_03160 [Haloarcula sp. CBA1115]